MLKVIKSKVLFSDCVYSRNEDERMALPVLRIFKKKLLGDQQVINWIGGFGPQLEEKRKTLSDSNRLNIRLNVRNFLRSLYFRLRFENMGDRFQKNIEETLDTIRDF